MHSNRTNQDMGPDDIVGDNARPQRRRFRRDNVAAIGLIAITCLVLRDRREPTCLRATAHTSSTTVESCQHQPEQALDPHAGVQVARALLRRGKSTEALLIATRWFDSGADATARQIAGVVHQRRDEHSIAEALLRRALDGHVTTNEHVEAARDAQLLSGSLKYLEKLDEALDMAKRAVELADRTDQQRLKGSCRLALGKILAEIGDDGQAREMFIHALDQTAAWPADRAWVYLNLGMLGCDTGRRPDGVELLKAALDLARAHSATQVVAAALLNLARCERELDHSEAAAKYLYELGPEESEKPSAQLVAGLIAADRGDLTRADRLLALAAAAPPTGDYAIDIALQRGKIAERTGNERDAERFYRDAIRLVDKLRADNKLELRPWVLAHRREPHSALLALVAHTRKPMDALEIAEQLHARTWHDTVLNHSRAKGTHTTIPQVEEVEHSLRKAVAPALSRTQLLSLLHGRDALLFSDTGGGVWRFHVVDGIVKSLDRLPESIPALIDQWRVTPDDRALERLGEALIPPDAYESSTRPLYIVADGMLGALPFAALRHADRYLVETRVLARLPGVIALQCRSDDDRARSAVFFGDSRSDLPAARDEAIELAHRVGGKAFVGDAVTLANVIESRHETLLHFAVHRSEQPGGPSLLLADSSLSSADVVRMKIGPRLVVLAGCATALSRDAEGWDALSSAFLISGSSTVIATLQSVKDADSARLVRRFYELDGEQRPAVALARTQREYLSSRELAHWASFIAFGSVDASDCVSPR